MLNSRAINSRGINSTSFTENVIDVNLVLPELTLSSAFVELGSDNKVINVELLPLEVVSQSESSNLTTIYLELEAITVNATSTIVDDDDVPEENELVFDASLTLPSLLINSSRVQGQYTIVNLSILPIAVVSKTSQVYFAEITLPALTANTSVLVGNDALINISLPLLEVRANLAPDISVVLPFFELTSTLYSNTLLGVSVDLPKLVVMSILSAENIIVLDVSIKELTLNSTLAAGIGIKLEIELPSLVSDIKGSSGNNVSVNLVLDELKLTGSLYSDSIATANLLLPVLELYSSLREDLVNVFSTYAINLDNYKVGEYTDFETLAMVKIDGEYIAITPDGVYLMGGETDNGNVIDARVRFGADDMGSDNLKRLQYAYVGARGYAEMKMLVDGDKTTAQYDVSHSGDGLRTTRIKMGKGTKSRYWQPEIQGNNFEIDSISLEAEILSRKVA